MRLLAAAAFPLQAPRSHALLTEELPVAVLRPKTKFRSLVLDTPQCRLRGAPDKLHRVKFAHPPPRQGLAVELNAGLQKRRVQSLGSVLQLGQADFPQPALHSLRASQDGDGLLDGGASKWSVSAGPGFDVLQGAEPSHGGRSKELAQLPVAFWPRPTPICGGVLEEELGFGKDTEAWAAASPATKELLPVKPSVFF